MIAAWKAAQGTAKANAKPATDTYSENHIDADCGDHISTDPGQTVGDSPTTKQNETG